MNETGRGRYYMLLGSTAALGTYYPDPNALGVASGTAFASSTAGNSPFASGNARCVVRSIHVLTVGAASTTIQLKLHDNSTLLTTAISGTAVRDIYVNMRCGGDGEQGFSVTTATGSAGGYLITYDFDE